MLQEERFQDQPELHEQRSVAQKQFRRNNYYVVAIDIKGFLLWKGFKTENILS